MKNLQVTFLLFLTLALSASAETLRVNPSKVDRLQSVLDNLKEGDTVIFERGVYRTKKALKLSEVRNVTLRGEGKVEIVLDNLEDPVIWVSDSQRVRISKLRARHQLPNKEYACEGAVVRVDGSLQVAVTESELDGCGAAGVYAVDTKDLVVFKNKIFNNSFAAVWTYNTNGLVRGNHIYKNAADLVSQGGSDMIFLDNVIEKNKGNDFYGSTDWVFEITGER